MQGDTACVLLLQQLHVRMLFIIVSAGLLAAVTSGIDCLHIDTYQALHHRCCNQGLIY
jgi:hypothetical protein